MTTIAFPREPRARDSLLARLSSLPRDVTPSRDLWPGIRARLNEQTRAAPRTIGLPAALAAGFLVAAVSALLTWGLMRDSVPASGEAMLAGLASPQPSLLPVSYGPNSALGDTQLNARQDLFVTFRQCLVELSPGTRDTVLKNLAVIQRAAIEIDAALAQDPASGLLNDLLLSTYREELQLYSSVIAAGDAEARRT